MPCHLLHRSLKSVRRLVTAELAGGFDEAGGFLTGIKSENSMKDVFLALKKRGLIEQVPGKRGSAYAWRKTTGGGLSPPVKG